MEAGGPTDQQAERWIVAFQRTVRDVERLDKLLLERAPTDWYARSRYVTRIVVILLAFGAAILLNGGQYERGMIATVVLPVILVLWITFAIDWVMLRWIRRASAQDPRTVGYIHVELFPSGVLTQTEVSEEFISWMGVSDIVEIEGMIGIMTGRVSGVFIPMDAFQPAAGSLFLRQAKIFYRDRHQNRASELAAASPAEASVIATLQ